MEEGKASPAAGSLSSQRCSLYLEYDAVAAIEEEEDDEDEVDGDKDDDGSLG